MKYDVISVGSASIDVFIGSKSKDIEMQKIHAHEDVCMPIGAKILLGKLYADVGGAGVNSSISFSRLGFKTGLLSKLGKDMHAEIILHRLKKEKVEFGLKGLGTVLHACFLANHLNELNHATAEAPFVVVPSEDFNKVAFLAKHQG